jgi:hypothetical protein
VLTVIAQVLEYLETIRKCRCASLDHTVEAGGVYALSARVIAIQFFLPDYHWQLDAWGNLSSWPVLS